MCPKSAIGDDVDQTQAGEDQAKLFGPPAETVLKIVIRWCGRNGLGPLFVEHLVKLILRPVAGFGLGSGLRLAFV